jgi:putative membrane protein
MNWSLPEHFLSDLVAVFGFGIDFILLLMIGYKVFDWLTPRCDFPDELVKKNIAVAIVISALFIALAIGLGMIGKGIIG